MAPKIYRIKPAAKPEPKAEEPVEQDRAEVAAMLRQAADAYESGDDGAALESVMGFLDMVDGEDAMEEEDESDDELSLDNVEA